MVVVMVVCGGGESDGGVRTVRGLYRDDDVADFVTADSLEWLWVAFAPDSWFASIAVVQFFMVVILCDFSALVNGLEVT